MFEIIVNYPVVFFILLAILGLIVGSFLNVVIHRLPLMLKRDYTKECIAYLQQIVHLPISISEKDLENSSQTHTTPYNLATPSSHCPVCHTRLKFWHNIPLLSYLFLKGRCAICHTKIPLRYLIVELLSVAVALLSGWAFGSSLICLAACVFGWYLLVISFIDIEHQLIPDILTMTLLWLGLFFSCFEIFTNSHDAIVGAMLGYLFLWGINQLFFYIRKKEGMGHGDFKLFAAVSAWVGWQLLPCLTLTSSIIALIAGVAVLWYKKLSRHTPIPFAPFIAIAAWIALIWGFDLTQTYLQFFKIDWISV
jgi:leader peptidase (prepilin peptidase) / N-methyltransferase